MSVSLATILATLTELGGLAARMVEGGRDEATQEEMDAATARLRAAEGNLDDAIDEARRDG